MQDTVISQGAKEEDVAVLMTRTKRVPVELFPMVDELILIYKRQGVEAAKQRVKQVSLLLEAAFPKEVA